MTEAPSCARIAVRPKFLNYPERTVVLRPPPPWSLGRDAVELAAGADAELGEDLAQVVLDRTGADEQPGADLRVRQAVPGQPGHLGLLGGQRFAGLAGRRAGGLGGALAGGFAGSQQLPA